MAKVNRSKSQISEDHDILTAYNIFLINKKSVCAESTYNTYRDIGYRIIVPELEKLSCNAMSNVDASCLLTILHDYGENHSDGGKHFLYRHLKSFINWYWNEFDITRKNPITSIRIKQSKKPPKEGITRAEIEKLIITAKQKSNFPERDIAMLMILCDTGIRMSSLANLRIKDINTARNELVVFEKDQDYHTKVFGSACGKSIRAYLRCLENVKPDDSFWFKMDGTPLVKRGLREILIRLCHEAKIKQHYFHDFRRFYGLELYKSTHDIYFVSRALDHKSIEVTKRYLAIDMIEDAEAIRAMSPMDNKGGVTIKRKGR